MGALLLLFGMLGAGGLWYQIHKNDPKNQRFQLTFPEAMDGDDLRTSVFHAAEVLGGFLESANGKGGFIVSLPPHIPAIQLANAMAALGAPGIAKIAGASIENVPGFDYVIRNNQRALHPDVNVYLQPDGRFFDDTGPTASLRRMNDAGGSISGDVQHCVHGNVVGYGAACRSCGWETDEYGNHSRGRTSPPHRGISIAGQRWDGHTLTGPTTHHRQGISDGGRTLADNGTRRRRTW